MQKVRLGRTNLMVTKTSLGCLPLQRNDFEAAKEILRASYNAGINFYDTARAYSDSEEKIGYALLDVRRDIIIATKSQATTKEGVLADIQTSLQKMKTDYVDILQLHNPQTLPDPENRASSYAGLIEAKKRGYCRFIGMTQHKCNLAEDAVKSGLYDTVQYPFSCLSTEDEIALSQLCKEHDVGFIAMKAMAGGLIKNVKANFAFIKTFDNVVPIFGVQKMEELTEFIGLDKEDIIFDAVLKKEVEEEKAGLKDGFCRGCGYCMPCSAAIKINFTNRMSLLIRRSPYAGYLSDEWKENMEQVENCTNCGICMTKCPYDLDIPALLKENLEDYKEFYKLHINELG